MRPRSYQQPHPPIWIGGNARSHPTHCSLCAGLDAVPIRPKEAEVVRTAAISETYGDAAFRDEAASFSELVAEVK
jgi:hypothetical protein